MTVTEQSGRQVWRRFSHLHQLVSQTVKVRRDGSWRTVQETTLEYPTGATGRLADAPATFQLPEKTTVISRDPDDQERARAVSVTARYDQLGRVIEQVQGGVRTQTSYGAFSQPTRIETTDLGTGERSVVTNELTGDETAVAVSETHATPDDAGDDGSEGEGGLVLVSRTEYAYQHGDPRLSGEVAQTAVTGDAGAAGGDPGPAITQTETTIDEQAGTRTDRVTGPDGVPTVTVSDVASGLVFSTGVAGREPARTVYDRAGLVVREIAPDGSETSVERDRGPDGGEIVTTRREADGYATRTVTDQLGREIEARDNYAPETGVIGSWRTVAEQEYNQAGEPVAVRDVAGRETRTSFDVLGRPARVSDPSEISTEMVYDDVANTVTTGLVPAGASAPARTETQASDDQGRPVRSETSFADGTAGVVSETAYDAFGRPRQRSGTGPFAVAHEYAASGALAADHTTPTREGEGQGALASYELDAFGAKTAKTLQSGGEQVEGLTEEHDAAGRVRSSTDPTGKQTTYAYSPAGQVETTTRADGTVLHARYDEQDRLIESWAVNADGERSEHLHRAYDQVTGQLAAIWRDGQRTGTEVAYRYHADGSVATITYPGNQTVRYTYTRAGEVASVTDPTGAHTDYDYDPGTGRLIRAVQSRDGAELARVAYDYDTQGRLALVRRHGGEGALTRYAYDDADRMTRETHTRADGTVLEEHDYGYDEQGRLTVDLATVDGAATATRYMYDPEGRLTRSTRRAGHDADGSVLADRRYTLDLAANITSTTDGAKRWLFGHDPANRTTTTATTTGGGEAVEQVYDPAGRLTHAADGTRYRYDALDQLVEVRSPDGTRTGYTYYPTGQRASQSVTTAGGETSTITYVYGADGAVISERDEDGASASYLLGHTRETRTLTTSNGATAATRYYLTGRRGDKTATTDPHGQLHTRTAYTDYGSATRTANTGQPVTATPGLGHDPYGYTGAPHDPNGLIYLQSRYYQPTLTAFLTADTPAAGMLNAYTYATGDPINHTDPTGMAPEWLNWGNAMATGGLLVSAGSALAVLTTLPAGLTAAAVITFGMTVAELAVATPLVLEQLGMLTLPAWGSTALTVTATVIGLASFVPAAYARTIFSRKSAVLSAHRFPPNAKPQTLKERALQVLQHAGMSGSELAKRYPDPIILAAFQRQRTWKDAVWEIGDEVYGDVVFVHRKRPLPRLARVWSGSERSVMTTMSEVWATKHSYATAHILEVTGQGAEVTYFPVASGRLTGRVSADVLSPQRLTEHIVQAEAFLSATQMRSITSVYELDLGWTVAARR